MKKSITILALLFVGVLTITTVHAKENNSEASNSVCLQVNDDYQFVGEYSFCTLDQCNTSYFKVYQKGSSYYVYRDSTYYRLMPCNESGYNHYYAYGGIKYYVKL